MSTDMTTTPAPFPDSGRPVLWWPRPRQLLVILLLGLILLGMPPPAAAEGAHPLWQSPVEGNVVEEFAAPPAPWASGHRGVDLAASAGGEIRSPADGVVSFSGVVVDREVLSINHGGGYVSSFEPVESDLEVGDSVTEGQTVAELSTYNDGGHHCDSPCLHWGVRLHGEYINPLLLIGELEPSILLPLID